MAEEPNTMRSTVITLVVVVMMAACSPGDGEPDVQNGEEVIEDSARVEQASPQEPETEDGPFGFRMGEDPESYGCEVALEFAYICTDVPKPHPDVETYYVWSFPETGIAFIKALGKTHDGDKYGSNVRPQIDRVANQLAIRYGPWQKHDDFIRSSGIWRDADEWAASVNQDERLYSYIWDIEEDDHVADIALMVLADRLHDTHFGLDFTLKNMDEFNAVRENRGADSF